MISKLKTFLVLPAGHKRVFLQIALLVPLVELGLQTLRFRRTCGLLEFLLGKKRSGRPGLADERRTVMRHANFLRLYRRQSWLPGKCLARSLAVWFLLKRAGIKTDLRFGMKKEDEKLLAHAWLEYRGEPLDAEADRDQGFTPFSGSIRPEIMR